jgi:hypothetical protein
VAEARMIIDYQDALMYLHLPAPDCQATS